MEKAWICRNYQEGDEYQILALFDEVFGNNPGLHLWRWRFLKNPFGKGIIKLLFDGDRLIGHYSIIPLNIEVQCEPIRVGFSLDTMTHPSYAKRGIFTFLAQETYNECQLLGLRLVYGFPNANSYHGFTNRLGWLGFDKMSPLYKRLEQKTYHPQFSKRVHDISRVEKFGDDVDPLWQNVRGGYGVVVPRTKEFLNWRYAEHPEVSYIKYLSKNNNGSAEGYLILKVFEAENETRGHIVDILSLNDKDIVKDLVRTALCYFLEKGINNISCWMQDNFFYADILKDEGFVRQDVNGPYPYFGVKVFNDTDIVAKDVLHFPNWYLTMGDCDIF